MATYQGQTPTVYATDEAIDKRIALIDTIKKTSTYKLVEEWDVVPELPDPSDRSISKRTWEKDMKFFRGHLEWTAADIVIRRCNRLYLGTHLLEEFATIMLQNEAHVREVSECRPLKEDEKHASDDSEWTKIPMISDGTQAIDPAHFNDPIPWYVGMASGSSDTVSRVPAAKWCCCYNDHHCLHPDTQTLQRHKKNCKTGLGAHRLQGQPM